MDMQQGNVAWTCGKDILENVHQKMQHGHATWINTMDLDRHARACMDMQWACMDTSMNGGGGRLGGRFVVEGRAGRTIRQPL
jgi:hypothetical protein